MSLSAHIYIPSYEGSYILSNTFLGRTYSVALPKGTIDANKTDCSGMSQMQRSCYFTMHAGDILSEHSYFH